jgi:hypothetical protein
MPGQDSLELPRRSPAPYLEAPAPAWEVHASTSTPTAPPKVEVFAEPTMRLPVAVPQPRLESLLTFGAWMRTRGRGRQ